ncbi:MAG: shikimate kinase [Defluviitaleaceae bacterium]|nr:shikimate kinase [Defluviitaleaceae bacterium]
MQKAELKIQNIALVGMMGVGKSTIGAMLAKALDMGFFDIDAQIELEQKTSIAEIFNTHSEEYFRMLEHEQCKKIPQIHNTVISTGGGTILNPKNTKILQENSTVIYLSANEQTLQNRLVGTTALARPLLQQSSIIQILKNRQNLYKQIAHHTITTDKKTPQDVLSQILSINISAGKSSKHRTI